MSTNKEGKAGSGSAYGSIIMDHIEIDTKDAEEHVTLLLTKLESEPNEEERARLKRNIRCFLEKIEDQELLNRASSAIAA